MKYKILFSVLVACPLFLVSCFKDTVYTNTVEGSMYMPQAVNDRNILTVTIKKEAQNVTFGTAYGGVNTFDKDIYVTYEIDTSLVSTYNSTNETSYLVIPDSAYSVSSLIDTIPAGKTSSNSKTLTIQSSKLDYTSIGVKYLLPIRIKSVSDGVIDSTYGITYFTIDSLYKQTLDVTSQGTLSVNIENINGSNGANNSEGSSKLVDNSASTKYLIYNYSDGIEFWFMETFSEPIIVNLYTITSANDADTRDIKEWEFQGSNDTTSAWTTLDYRSDETWSGRNVTNTYTFSNSTAYMYYRVNVLKNNGATLVQIAEWRLLQYVVE
ncbi:MAG: DUF1735 domain-containing protein [Chitinophagaceae bacterium]